MGYDGASILNSHIKKTIQKEMKNVLNGFLEAGKIESVNGSFANVYINGSKDLIENIPIMSGVYIAKDDEVWVMKVNFNQLDRIIFCKKIVSGNSEEEEDLNIRIFTEQPYPPYSVGDLWIQEDSKLFICIISKLATEFFDEADWKSTTKFVEDIIKDIADDNKFDPSEKKTIKILWGSILKEKPKLDEQALLYSTTTTEELIIYDEAYRILDEYISPMLTEDQMSITNDIIREDFIKHFDDYYDARSILLITIEISSKNRIEDIEKKLKDIADDGMLEPLEKKVVKTLIIEIEREYPSLISQAELYDSDTHVEKLTYIQYYTDLMTYITPLLLDMTITNEIIREDFLAYFNNYYNAKIALLTKIEFVHKTLSDKFARDIEELNNSILVLLNQINDFSSDGVITLAEAKALEISFVQVQTESNDIIAMAIDPKIMTINITTLKNAYVLALDELLVLINYWITLIKYPATITKIQRKEITDAFGKVETTKNKLEIAIMDKKDSLVLDSTGELLVDLGIDINSFKMDVQDFSKDSKITLSEANTMANSMEQLRSESDDVIRVALELGVVTEANDYTRALDELENELTLWVGLEIYTGIPPDEIYTYPKDISALERTSLLNKFKAVQNTKSRLINAIGAKRQEDGNEYSVDGLIYCKGTGHNRSGSRVLKLNNKTVSGTHSSGTGLELTIINRADLTIKTPPVIYNTYEAPQDRLDLANVLDGLDDSVIVVLASYDSIGWDENLLRSIANCGGSGTDTGFGRFPYAFIGIPGIYKGSGLEMFSDSGIKSPYAEISTKIIDGTPHGIASASSIIARNAIIAAEQAQISADDSNKLLTEIAKDGVVKASEKAVVKREWSLIQGGKDEVLLEAEAYSQTDYPAIGVAMETHEIAYNSLEAYVNPILVNMKVSSMVDSVYFQNIFKAYYDAKISLLKVIADVAKNYIDDVVGGLTKIIENMRQAMVTAASDNSIDSTEAGSLLASLNQINVESASTINLANQLEIITETQNYQNALTALQEGLNPWLNQSSYPISISEVQKDEIQVLFQTAQDTKTILVNKITLTRDDGAKTYTDEAIIGFRDTIYASDKADMQQLLDGKVDCWFYNYDPTLLNVPYIDWKSKSVRNEHLGDLFLNMETNIAYRFIVTNKIYSWEIITDEDLTLSLIESSISGDTADRKRRIFVSVPKPPYSVGDLWTQGEEGDLLVCQVNKVKGSYIEGDFISSTKYTDDTVANMAKELANQAQLDANKANEEIAEVAKDTTFSISEKKTVRPIWDAIVAERANIIAQAQSYSVDTTSYLNYYNVLSSYITPMLNDITNKSPIVSATFKANFSNYYNSKNEILTTISNSAKTYVDTKTPIYSTLDNESTTITTDSLGNGGNYTGAISKIYIYKGGTDDTANWTVTTVASSGIVGYQSGKSYQVTNMVVDSGYVEFTAKQTGSSDIIKRYTLAKSKSGVIGKDATSYWLITDAPAIAKAVTGVYTPNTITITAKSQTGENSPVNYSGRFIIEDSVDGINYIVRYTGNINESTKTYSSFTAGIKTIRVSLYLAGGISTLLDQQVIPIISDGANGTIGSNGKTYILNITNGTRSVSYNSSGVNPTPAQSYFYCELYENGVYVSPSSYYWTSTGNLSGTSYSSYFLPTCSNTFNSSLQNSVSLSVVYAGITIKETVPIALVKDGATGQTGQTGASGSYVSNVFMRSSSQPTYPSGIYPSGWYDAPPTGTLPLWFSKATIQNGVLIVSWSYPVKLTGENGASGDSIIVEYSVNGSTSWHSTYATGDMYMHTKIGVYGTFGTAIKIVGEKGADGSKVAEGYIPLFNLDNSSYLSISYNSSYWKYLTHGSSSLTLSVNISSNNILYTVPSTWSIGTTFALEATMFSSISSDPAYLFLELWNGYGFTRKTSVEIYNTIASTVRSTPFTLSAGNQLIIGGGPSYSGHYTRLVKAGLIVYPV